MSSIEYLRLVVETIATHGNRGNKHFISAFSIAQQALRTGFSDEVMTNEVKRTKDELKAGLNEYRPGADWFDVRTEARYTELLTEEL